MELGNLIFGNSRGEWPIPRTAGYEQPISDLFEALGLDYAGYDPANDRDGFECGLFVVRHYWWGGCQCGFDAAEDAWNDANPEHDPGCYQHAFRAFDAPWAGGRYTDAYEAALGRFLKPWGLPKQGCAIHCTCTYDAKWERFLTENQHDPACRIVAPNFEHRPSGLEVRWYKYPLRDSYASRPVERKEWRRIMAECEREAERIMAEKANGSPVAGLDGGKGGIR